MLKIICMIMVMGLLAIGSTAIAEDGNPWYYSRTEVDTLYETHYNRESRLDNYIHEMKDRKYIAEIQYDKAIMVPPEFIQHILNHLESAIDNGWVSYIFWPDLNHGHLFVPVALWEENYSGTEELFVDQITRLLKDDMDKLGILYHAAEHFGHYDPANKEAIRTRNVIGWFNWRPIELAYPDPEESESEQVEANRVDDPKGYKSRRFIAVSACKNGYFAIHPNGKEIRLDISFDVNDIYDSTIYPRKKPENIGWDIFFQGR